MIVPDLVHMLMDQIEHVILRTNIVIELPHRHPTCFCDVADRRRMIALLEKYLASPIHNLLMSVFNEWDILTRGKDKIFWKLFTPLFRGRFFTGLRHKSLQYSSKIESKQ